MARINERYIGLVCMLAATVVSATQRYHDCIQKKNIVQAQEECLRYLGIPCARSVVFNDYIYPNDTETKCLVRCMGINLGWWSDSHGVQEPAISKYFHPDPDDMQYDRRTYHCLMSQRLNDPASRVDACDRAYESFRCYYEQYGNIIVTPQFVPLNPLQLSDVILQCATILKFPSLDSELSDERVKPSERDIGCLARCFLLRTGLYSDQHGPNLDRLYVQCNNYTNETRFRESTSTCYQQLKIDCKDECILTGRFLRECFYDGGLFSTLTAITGNVFPITGITGTVHAMISLIIGT